MSRIHKSEAQSNAEALARRSAPFAPENRTSAGMAYDFRRRQPRDLREAVRLVRKAYQDEVPTKLHEGDALADDGTPAMTSRAEAYIFGSPTWTDAGHGEKPLVAFYLTPFRATLGGMLRATAESSRKRGAIVQHVAFGMEPEQAAAEEGVPSWCTRLVAYDALATFLRQLTDVRIDVAKEDRAA